MTGYTIAALPVAIWVYLLCARGRFWQLRRPQEDAAGAAPARRVVVLIPARDEAAVVGRAITSLAQQSFNGSLEVILIDDGSSDGTAEVARAAARAGGLLPRLRVLRGSALPGGWTGKLWALAQGVAATHTETDYFLFTDADIAHGSQSVATLVASAEAQERDLVSHMVMLSTATSAERFLIPAFVFFFFKLYPPRWAADPRRRLAAAAGGCILIRPRALERIGGLQAIRSCIIDDCALARAVKDRGGRIALSLSRETRSLRIYGSAAEIGTMISRTAFAQLGHSYLLLAGTLAGLFLTYLLPVALLVSGHLAWAALGALALVMMAACYLPMVRFYGLSPLRCLCLPGIAAFYLGAVVHSAAHYARGSGGQWKGRVQDARRAGSR